LQLDNLHYKRRYDLEFQNGEVIWVELNLKHCFILLCTVYRPEGSIIPSWDNFQNSIENALRSNSEVVINVDLLSDQIID